MNIKEVVGKVKKLNEILCEETISDIVSVLQYGGKFEQMWEELKKNTKWMTTTSEMDLVEQKYFPEPKKEIVELLKKIDKEVKEILNMCGG